MGEIDMRKVLLLICSAPLLCLSMMAQIGSQSSVTGIVSDSSGAMVAGAKVTIANLANGFTTNSVTDERGKFAVLALPAGTYRVTATSNGFKTWEAPVVQLTVGDEIRVNPVLQVGSATESVSVQAGSEALQSENATVETVVQLQQIRELPLDDRNPIMLLNLVPGLRTTNNQDDNFEHSVHVQGYGMRDNKTGFQLDGILSNGFADEGGTGIPNVDAIAEFNVQSLNFTAASGRNPMQVQVVTKSGSNDWHGGAFEYVQNDMFNARNYFASEKNRVRYNQFGGFVGGPIIKNKTFFFFNWQGTVTRNAQVFNVTAPTAAMMKGDFSAAPTPIEDPITGNPFPGNIIPSDRINPASAYFLPWLTQANFGNTYRADPVAVHETWETTVRVDHQLRSSQRIYGRYLNLRSPKDELVSPFGDVNPSHPGKSEIKQHSFAGNYTWTLSNNTLLTVTAGFFKGRQDYTNSALGKQNDSELAGIQGIPSEGRAAWIGPPDIAIGGYNGLSFPGGWGTPGHLWGSQYNGKVAFSHVQGAHILSAGFEYGDTHAYGAHGSEAGRGRYGFFSTLTGDNFADFLLGYASEGRRNDPLAEFGQDRAPWTGYYIQDSFKATPFLSFDIGIRYERWLAHHEANLVATTWDPQTSKMVLAVGDDGKPNLSPFPNSQALAEETSDLWITATDAHYPRGLYFANGHWAPRVGVTFRPGKQGSIVLRAGYGMFYNSFTGNRGASVVNVPHWAEEVDTVAVGNLQDWRTLFSPAPLVTSGFFVNTPLATIKPARTHEWNVSVQTALPAKTALTVSYIGTRVPNEIGAREFNTALPGPNPNGDADRPHPRFNMIEAYDNLGTAWYNGLQIIGERRFATGLAYTFGYTFAKSLVDNVPDAEYDHLAVGSPSGYNRGRAPYDLRHIQSATVVWEIPYGHGHKLGVKTNTVLNGVLGGWQLSFLETARSGNPLNVFAGFNNLGNGDTSRASLVGDPHLNHPGPQKWFNVDAFTEPAVPYTFGNSPKGVIDGPGQFQINSSLAKNFFLADKRYFQIRWDAFNLFNHTDFGNPDTSVTDGSAFGQIFSAGPARYMQFALKFNF
jgi:hypothetical protein